VGDEDIGALGGEGVDVLGPDREGGEREGEGSGGILGPARAEGGHVGGQARAAMQARRLGRMPDAGVERAAEARDAQAREFDARGRAGRHGR
jgi:hypothetical protein